MKKLAAVIAIVLVVAVPATVFVCNVIRHARGTYDEDDVKIVAEGTDLGFTLVIQPPDETMYYCPGVRFVARGPSLRFERPTGSKSTTYYYEYVRSPLGRSDKVDIEAKPRRDGSLSITFPFLDGKWEKGDRIERFDSYGIRHGSTECLGLELPETLGMGR
jgi:hypothetical protein